MPPLRDGRNLSQGIPLTLNAEVTGALNGFGWAAGWDEGWAVSINSHNTCNFRLKLTALC